MPKLLGTNVSASTVRVATSAALSARVRECGTRRRLISPLWLLACPQPRPPAAPATAAARSYQSPRRRFKQGSRDRARPSLNILNARPRCSLGAVIFQPELETLARPELERLQLERLRERFGVASFEELAEQQFAT